MSWDDFHAIHTERPQKNAGPLGFALTIAFLGVAGAGLGFLAGFALLGHSGTADVSENELKWVLLVCAAIGAITGVVAGIRYWPRGSD